jgi:peptide deformylase
LEIVNYPYPTLRYRSKPIRRVDAELQRMIREMFDLMYAAKGVGLAANQVDLPFRLFVVNLKSASAAAEQERVFINPVLSRPKGQAEAEEGCLSLPGLYGDVVRPERIHVSAFDHLGTEIDETFDGLLGRVIQHETDHLDGVLFIDRLSPTGKMAARDQIEEFEIEMNSRRRSGAMPSDETIATRLAELETRYCG